MTEIEAIKELKEYAEYSWGDLNESFEMAIKALEKQIAKKPCLDQKGLLGVKMWHCPICKKEVISDWNRDLANDYCHHCGQKLYW